MVSQPLKKFISHNKQISIDQLNKSINSAMTFLLQAKNPEGWWEDYNFPQAASIGDEWVTAFVGTMLAIVPDARIPEALKQAWALLESRNHRPTGEWGYSYILCADADTTSWALKLAEIVGASNSERAKRAMAALTTHLQPDGGLATFSFEPIRAYIKVPDLSDVSFAGWCSTSHVCASASAAALPKLRSRLHDFLIDTQTPDGFWEGYWWCDNEYTTGLAVEALATSGEAVDILSIDRAVAWVLKRLSTQGFAATAKHPNGSTFATAWCLRILAFNTDDPEVKAAKTAVIDWLLEQQKPNGTWSPCAYLRIPFPFEKNPNQFPNWRYYDEIEEGDNKRFEGSIIFDHNSIYTTTSVVSALVKAAQVF